MTGKASKEDAPNKRRNSTGQLKSSNNEQIPNYLRASTGSCHDFCKYGKLHDFEGKVKSPILKYGHHSAQSAVMADRKMTTKTKPKHPPDLRTQHKGSLPLRRQVTLESASPNHGETCVKPAVVMLKGFPLKREASSSPSKKITSKSSSPSYNSVSVKPKLKSRASSSYSADAVEGLNSRRHSSLKVGQKKASASLVVTLSSKPSLNMKVASPVQNQVLLRKAEPKQFENGKAKGASGAVDDNEEKKPLHVCIVETENEASTGLLSPPLSSSTSLSHPNSAPLLSQGEDGQDSEYTVTDAEYCSSDDDETEAPSIVGALRKAQFHLSEDKDSEPARSRFRRGKIIELKSDLCGPKKLRFRQGRMLAESPDVLGNGGRRTFKKRAVAGDQRNGATVSEKVVLRHQDTEGKKGGKGLFNNVIEETANKLVETRKSKVKALVGAFETVISLQDCNS